MIFQTCYLFTWYLHECFEQVGNYLITLIIMLFSFLEVSIIKYMNIYNISTIDMFSLYTYIYLTQGKTIAWLLFMAEDMNKALIWCILH